jgi:hypothetical protein
MTQSSTFNSTGWVLAAGFALVAIGLARGAQDPPQTQAPLVGAPILGMADSNNRMIAVTGIDVTGSSILYLVDTVNYHLAIYQANGGSASTQGVKLVGARRIDLDMQLDGLNDKSKYSYKDLRDQFRSKSLFLDQQPESDQ